jgi:hypothetical protein
VLEEASPWSLVVEQTANQTLRELVTRDERVYEALLGYLRRGIEAGHNAHARMVEMLEPVLDRDSAREIFVRCLPRAWSSPLAYELPPRLIELPEIATTAREYVRHIIEQVEDRLVPTAAAAPLIGAAWLHWEQTEVIYTQLEIWLGRGSNHARLVGLLLHGMPGSVLETIRPALEAYLVRQIAPDDYEDAEARRLIFQILPRTRLVGDSFARFEQYALAHAAVRTTGSLAAIAALCRVVEPARGRELSTQAAQLRLDLCGFPDDDIQEHLQILVPLAPEEWLRVAWEHPLGLRTAAPIFEAVFANATPPEQSWFAHETWKRLGGWCTPYRATSSLDIVGRRPSDLAEEWLYRHADAVDGSALGVIEDTSVPD